MKLCATYRVACWGVLLSFLPLQAFAVSPPDVKYQPNPFGEVCKDSLLVTQDVYKANKAALDKYFAAAGQSSNVEVLPKGGWFAAVREKVGFAAAFGEKSNALLVEVGKRTAASINKNNLISETVVRCARGDSSWITANQREIGEGIKGFSDCGALIASLQAMVKRVGPKYRIAREIVRQEGSPKQSMWGDIKSAFGIGPAGEKKRLSDEEYKLALAQVDADVNAVKTKYISEVRRNNDISEGIEANHRPRIKALLDSNGISDPATQAEISVLKQEKQDQLDQWFRDLECDHKIDVTKSDSCPRLNAYNSPFYVAQFAQRSNELSSILSSTPVLAYLSTDNPSKEQLATAAEKVLGNGKNQAARVASLLQDQGESPEVAVNRRLELMKFSPSLKAVLLDQRERCGQAAGLLQYVQGLDAAKQGAINAATVAAIILPAVGWGLGAAASSAWVPASLSNSLASGALAASVAAQGAAWMSSGLWYLSVVDSVSEYKDEKEKNFGLLHANPDTLGAGTVVGDMKYFTEARNKLEVNVAWLALDAAMRASAFYKSRVQIKPTKEQLDVVRKSNDLITMPISQLEAGQLNVGKDQVVEGIINNMVPKAKKNPGGLLAEALEGLNKKVLPVSIGSNGRQIVLQDGHHFVSTQIYLQSTPYEDFPDVIKEVFSRRDQTVLRAKAQYLLVSPTNSVWYHNVEEQIFDQIKNNKIYIDPARRPKGYDSAVASLNAGKSLTPAEKEALKLGYQMRPLMNGLGNDPLRSAIGLAYQSMGINPDNQADFAQFLVGNAPGFRQDLIARGANPDVYSPELLAAVKAQLREQKWVDMMKSIPRPGIDKNGVPFSTLNDQAVNGAMSDLKKKP